MSGLSERLEDWADGLFHRGESFNGTDEEAADLLREAASALRASTHPEQSARVDSDTLHAIAQDAYNRALAPRDATCNPNDAMHEAVDAVLAALEPAPEGEGDDLASRLDERAELWERKGGLGANIAAGAYREAAQLARASTRPEQSGRALDPQLADALEALSGDWDGYPECARTNAQAVVDAYRNAASTTTEARAEWVQGGSDKPFCKCLLTLQGGCQGPPGPEFRCAARPAPSPTEQGEARVEAGERGICPIHGEQVADEIGECSWRRGSDHAGCGYFLEPASEGEGETPTRLYEADDIFLSKCKNITLDLCENVAVNRSANVYIGDCMIEHLIHNNIEHEQDNLHKRPEQGEARVDPAFLVRGAKIRWNSDKDVAHFGGNPDDNFAIAGIVTVRGFNPRDVMLDTIVILRDESLPPGTIVIEANEPASEGEGGEEDG